MKASPQLRKTICLLIGLASLLASPPCTDAAPNLTLWDTRTPLPDAAQAADRAGWKIVPGDLLALEANPPKASSDPGYYGRDYIFKGDAVVQNHALTMAFASTEGRVVLYSRAGANSGGDAEAGAPELGTRLLEIAPLFQDQHQPAALGGLEVLRNAGDQVILRVSFGPDSESSALFIFGRGEVLEIQPGKKLKGFTLAGPVDYGIVPSFIGDDLIYSAARYPDTDSLCVPTESFFLGLVPGEANEWVLTWPSGKQQMKLELARDAQGRRLIRAVDFLADGQSLFLAPLGAPGIWHQETLTADYLEKEVASSWKRPFPARWKTQLSEQGVTATFAFRPTKGEIWRGVAGSYQYPVWFEGDTPHYQLGKKVPPQGESLIYFLEAQDTPSSVPAPADILRDTLGRPAADAILDLTGRKLRTHHRRGGEGVRRACTCGCTEAIQAIFEKGEETAETNYVQGALGDMIYFVHRHVERIGEYRHFAQEMTQFLQAQANASPELTNYLAGLTQIAQQIPQECEVQKENMKSFAYADDLARQTMALTVRHSTNNLPAYMGLLKNWRDMGGAQDYVVALCHTLTRKLCQEAGYTAVDNPKAAALAREIRARCRQCLRNPDGYEIWADY